MDVQEVQRPRGSLGMWGTYCQHPTPRHPRAGWDKLPVTRLHIGAPQWVQGETQARGQPPPPRPGNVRAAASPGRLVKDPLTMMDGPRQAGPIKRDGCQERAINIPASRPRNVYGGGNRPRECSVQTRRAWCVLKTCSGLH